jgi:hypothetical protein
MLDYAFFIYDSRYIVDQNSIARDYWVKCSGVRKRTMPGVKIFQPAPIVANLNRSDSI